MLYLLPRVSEANDAHLEAAAPSKMRRARRRRESSGEDFEARFDPSRPQPEDRPVVQVLRVTNMVISRFYHRAIIKTPQYLPPRGPGILVCNHISGLDPLLLQSALSRAVVWMMAAEYYRINGLNWFLRQIDAIPVDRSGRDLMATRAALRALEAGRILGVFPEGRIAATQEFLPFQVGVAMMAIKAKVPIYPAYVEGTQRGKTMVDAFRARNESVVAFGRPLVLPQESTAREDLEAATALIRQSVETLRIRYRKYAPG
jgi:1-acyl-sn-glycerol-3-phosphate acyltransferase